MSTENNEDNTAPKPEPVTKGDIEFLLFLAESDNDRELRDKFISPAGIFKLYIEHSRVGDLEENTNDPDEVVYNIYVVTDGMYYMVGKRSTLKQAKRYASSVSIKLEKQLKKILSNSLPSSMSNFEERDENE